MSERSVGFKSSRIAIYTRVSTEEQGQHEDSSPRAQRDRCLAHIEHLNKAKKLNLTPIEQNLCDIGSGKDTNRTHFKLLWYLIETRQLDAVIATELSRISRSVSDFLAFIAHCNKYGVHLIILGMDLDTTSSHGKLILTILASLAEFERAVTGTRVKENAISRLLKDGKINGACELPGLKKDPLHKGHFLKDDETLKQAESILRLFLKVSSKKKTVEAANENGLFVKGKPLTMNALETILKNVRWRYRGLWYANEENKNADETSLPDYRRYQIVKLPHGPLLSIDLLDAVEDKLKSTYETKKKTGASGYTYLLQSRLVYEDGTHFTGESAKGLGYRYYKNRQNNIRIRCDELDPKIVKRLKSYLKGSDLFSRVVEDALKQRTNGLSEVENEAVTIRQQISETDKERDKLRPLVLGRIEAKSENVGVWLEGELSRIQCAKENLEKRLQQLLIRKDEVIRQTGLDNLQKAVAYFVEEFDDLTQIEKRTLVEKIVKKIVVKSDNTIELRVYMEPRLLPKMWRTKSGKVKELVSQGSCFSNYPFLQMEVTDNFEFLLVPKFKDKAFLHQKYVVEGLTLKEIGRLTFSSRQTVGKYLKEFQIPLRGGDYKIYGTNAPKSLLPKNQRREQKRELKTLEQIKAFRAKGLTYENIAEVLNSLDTPTKRRMGPWYPNSVRQLVAHAEGLS